MTTYTIDWLSYTYGKEPQRVVNKVPDAIISRYAHAKEVLRWKSEKPRYGYCVAYSPLSCLGPVVYFWPSDGRSHTHAQWSGSALAYHGQADTLLSEVVKQGARVTRLDLAVDIHAGDVLDVWFAAQRDELSTALRKRSLLTSDTGSTVYLGSRSSGRFVRIYDKAAQLGMAGPWIRAELELKGDSAHGMAQYIVQEGTHTIPSSVRAVVDCPTLLWWREAFDGHPPRWGVPKATVTPNRAAWIQQQVVPALISMAQTEPDAFVQTYRLLLRRVGEATGEWCLPFDGHEVERYNEVGIVPDEV